MRTVTVTREQLGWGPLILINRSHPHRPAPPPECVPVDSRYPAVTLEKKAAALLSACIQSVNGGPQIVPVSGWRSAEEQRRIWDETLRQEGAEFTSQYVAYPGGSEHQTGLAIDLGGAAPHIDFLRPDFPRHGVWGRFRAASVKYGFIERYQAHQTRLTGIAAEPWHFRYVGAPHAALMTEQGLCLEEYSGFLAQGPRRCVLDNGRTVEVRYVPCVGQETEIPLPDEGCCQVSGDNASGFVVTVWEAGR